MEAPLLLDQSISAHNHRARNGYASMSGLSHFHYPEIDSGNPNLSNHPPNYVKDSLFGNPPWVTSFSSFPSLQPPLLPLPLARNPSLPSKTRRLSTPSANPRKSNATINKTKDQKPALKKDSSRSPPKSLRAVSSTARLGPDPSKLPRELAPMVLRSSSSSSSSSLKAQSLDELDDHSGSIFSLAPHPSSLPLPKFSLRTKPAGCNAETGRSVDAAGATDDLRRLLRLPKPLMRTGSSLGDGVSGLFHPY